MLRRIAMLSCAALMAASAASATSEAAPTDDACNAAAPSAAICIGLQKPQDAAVAVCRTNGGPGEACPDPLAGYAGSWLHRTAAFQFGLGDSVPLRDAQWLGTHNSFNTDANVVTLSHTDSNQQLTLTEQLDGDIRSLELDLHSVPGGTSGGVGSDVVRVCHGRGEDELHAGCTDEPLFADVFPEIRTWLDQHPGEVVLLYLEDHVGDAGGYADVVDVLGDLVYHPEAARQSGCAELPLTLTRDQVLAAGKRIIAVGNCSAGWSGAVYGWNEAHTEAGNTEDFQAYPTCNPNERPDRLVRYFEDSTWLSAVTNPGETPADHEAGALTPARVAAMTACGVNLLGLDQFAPGDGRVEASIWSWAPNEPAAPGGCSAQRPDDGRWASVACEGVRPAACRTDEGFALSPAVAAAGAAAACNARGGTFDPPRTGEENARLRALAAGAAPWIAA